MKSTPSVGFCTFNQLNDFLKEYMIKRKNALTQTLAIPTYERPAYWRKTSVLEPVFIFRGHSTQECASLICDEEQIVTYLIIRVHTGTSGSQNPGKY